MASVHSTNPRKVAALLLVGMLLALDFAASEPFQPAPPDPDVAAVSHGALEKTAFSPFHRSKEFPRLGSIALNLTPCLHNTGAEMVKGFTCEKDLLSAYFDAHGNGDHFGAAFRHFNDYLSQRFLRLPGEVQDALEQAALANGYVKPDGTAEGWKQLRDDLLGMHGLSAAGHKPEEVFDALCSEKTAPGGKPLENSADLPAEFLDRPNVTLADKIAASSLCRFAPFFQDQFADSTRPGLWWQADYHEEHAHADPGLLEAATGDAEDAMGLAHAGHGHQGPHGLDVNTETNWLYVAMSHQGKVAIVNLNVVDWGSVARYETETGYRVLLFDDTSILQPKDILHYASNLFVKARGHEEAFAKSLDAVHRHCFAAARQAIEGQPYDDDLDVPPSKAELENALDYIAQFAAPPPVTPPPERGPGQPKTGWDCFLAFTGIDARPWTDVAFINPFCSFDTRHLAKFDAQWSPGRRSRTGQPGESDAWRCDWFVRYIDVTADVQLSVRRLIPLNTTREYPVQLPEDIDQEVSGPLAQTGDAAKEAYAALTGRSFESEWLEYAINVSIGPHDVVYNPVNGFLYVTHYWQFNDPDLRMLPDWTIHAIDGNPASPAFNNPYETVGLVRRAPLEGEYSPAPWIFGGTPPSLSCFANTGACQAPGYAYPWMVSKPYPIDVGGPVDGLHPITVDVDPRTGHVFTANRESNTVSVLIHDGSRDLTANKAEATLSGEIQLAVDPATIGFQTVQRDFGQYHDPDSLDPTTPAELQGYTRVTVGKGAKDCGPLNDLAAGNAATSLARDLCGRGLLAAERLGAPVEETARPVVEAMLLRLLEAETPWFEMLGELRALAAVDDADFLEALRSFREAWLPRLTLAADRDFLVERLDKLVTIAPSLRRDAVVSVFAETDARWPGLMGPFLEDVLASLPPAILTPELELGDQGLSLVPKWQGAAGDGSLLGFKSSTMSPAQLTASIRAVEPIVSASAISGAPAWLAYCVSYSAYDWLNHFLARGEDPWTAAGDESDNGLHPFHCDDVKPPHEPGGTPLQWDYVGKSNHHDVFIIREPVGPLLLDYWYESRPRLLQPFDIWVNPGDNNVYVSNLGNHDNVPLVLGWLTIIQPGDARCYRPDNKMKHIGKLWPGLGGIAQLAIFLASCLATPRPYTPVQTNLLLDMGLMPHHINVNPYSMEVYGGHLLSDYVMVGEFEEERIDWTIPKAHVFGSDVVPGSAPVPNPNPTGIGVNPSTQRVFMTHFQQHEPLFVPLTGRTEDMSRYVTVMDLRNYSLLPELIYGGDHHAVVDANRPPGMGAYEQPFYNRSLTIETDGQVRTGSPVFTTDSSQAISWLHRCTYYRVRADNVTSTLRRFASPIDGVTVVGPSELHSMQMPSAQGSNFTAGRCFNLFDLEPIPEDLSRVHEWKNHTIYEDPTTDIYWEYGEESLTFGVVNLFFDPDNVPPTLRFIEPREPHGRVQQRDVPADVFASEELAAAWVEADAGEDPLIPMGALPLSVSGIDDPSDWTPNVPWSLTFNTAYHVEWPGPPRDGAPDRMTVQFTRPDGAATKTFEVANWSASYNVGPAWVETRIPLRAYHNQSAQARLNFTFDSLDARDNQHSGWTLVEARIQEFTGAGTPRTYVMNRSLPGYSASGMVSEEKARVEGEEQDTLAFHDPDTGTYQTILGRAFGTFSFDANLVGFTDPVLVLVHRQDVEKADRPWRGGQPYDRMFVEASLDDGATWRTVWTRDSRDNPETALAPQEVDISGLVEVASGAWYARHGYPVRTHELQFRLTFDAVDPLFNGFPGWKIRGLAASGDGTHYLDAQAALGPDPDPGWWMRNPLGSTREYIYSNNRDAYDFARAAKDGGAFGLACRLDHGPYGEWQGGILRGPGSGALNFFGRDLAGQIVNLNYTLGDGVLLVEDAFTDDAFTESYWLREEFDPAGVGYPAYVFDPLMDGMGDILPEDTPTDLVNEELEVILNPGTGEMLRGPRGILRERDANLSNFFVNSERLVTEAASLVSDAPQYRRAFVLTPADSDLERLAEELARVLKAEGMWLNSTHLMRFKEPQPILNIVNELLRDVNNLNILPGNLLDPDLGKILGEILRAAKMAAHARQTGLRDQPPDEYVIDGTPSLPAQATEILSHPFLFRRDASAPQWVELNFDYVARHRFEDYVVPSKPFLPRLDTELLDYIIHNVTLDKLHLVEGELTELLGPPGQALQNDTAWLENHTLADLEYTLQSILDLLYELGNEQLSIEVPASEILNDLDRLQLSLPAFGEAFGVRIVLEGPDGTRTLLSERDAVSLQDRLDVSPKDPVGDVRVTLAPLDSPGTYQVRLAGDVGRFEKIRLRVEGSEAQALFPTTGTYRLHLESTIRGGDALAPGLFYDLAYGPIGLRLGGQNGQERPDAGFSWVGPVSKGSPVALLPVRAGLGNLEDQDGYARRYRWTFPEGAVARVEMNGHEVLPDADDTAADDVFSNFLATDYGRLASRLTYNVGGPSKVDRLTYEAHGCNVPLPIVTFGQKGSYAVELVVEDEDGNSDRFEPTIAVGTHRAPEFLADPFEDDGQNRLLWQTNNGSMLLRSRGRSIDLRQFFDTECVSLSSIANVTQLVGCINWEGIGEFTNETLEDATTTGDRILNATLHDPSQIPDILLDFLLLVRPGITRVVTETPEDAQYGLRAQVQTGQMPGPTAISIPLLGLLLGQDLGFKTLPQVLRFARSAQSTDDLAKVNYDLAQLCGQQGQNPPQGGVGTGATNHCDPSLEDINRLLREGLLDAWIFRFALHPSNETGQPDLNRTLAQVTLLDTGVGLIVLAAVDKVEDVVRLEKDLFNAVRTSALLNVSQLDPLVPISPYVNVTTLLQQEAVRLAEDVLRIVGSADTLLATNPPASQLQEALGLTELVGGDLSEAPQRLQEVSAAIDDAHARATDYVLLVNDTIHLNLDTLDDEGLMWANNAVTDISLSRASNATRRARENVTQDALDALAALGNATESARKAVRALNDAVNATQYWAENWTASLDVNNPQLLVDRVLQTEKDVETYLEYVKWALADTHNGVVRSIEHFLDEAELEGVGLLDPNHIPLTLGYNATNGQAIIRAGEEVLAEGTIAGPLPRYVHASATLISIGNHSAEIQALWAGNGSDLLDGFNRNDENLEDDGYDVQCLGRTKTWCKANASIVAEPTGGTNQLVWITRSVEGEQAKLLRQAVNWQCGRESNLLENLTEQLPVDVVQALPAADLLLDLLTSNQVPGGFVNRHRYYSDARSSPPGTCAARMVDSVLPTTSVNITGSTEFPEVYEQVDPPEYVFSKAFDLATGTLQEFRASTGPGERRSAPAVSPVVGPPPAAHIFDVRVHQRPQQPEELLVAFQETGIARPAITSWQLFASPRPVPDPDATVQVLAAELDPPGLPVDPVEPAWSAGNAYHVFRVTGPDLPFPAEWRYLYVRGVNETGVPGAFSTAYRVPPLLLEERFALQPQGRLQGPDVTINAEPGDIHIRTARIDTCLGDRVDVVREHNYPHDQIAARWARALRVQERGLDSVFMLLREFGKPLNTFPMNLWPIDQPLSQVDLKLCPSVRELLEEINGLPSGLPEVELKAQLSAQGKVTLQQGLGITLDANLDVSADIHNLPISPHRPPGIPDRREIAAYAEAIQQLVEDTSLDLTLEDLLNGTPASAEWRTENASGPYYARVRFLIPGPQLGQFGSNTPLDRLIPSLQTGLLNALIPGERFHLLQLGHDDGTSFQEVLRVDFDPHLLAPVDPERTAAFLDQILALERDPVGALAAGNIPLAYGIAAGDTATNREIIGAAMMDHWHTIEVFAPHANADVYAVMLDGKWAGQFRTSSKLTPNALRIGGSNVPTEVLVDDVRFMDAIHPPAPVAQVVRAPEPQGFATVRWHMPETGGAPLTDFNLLRVDLDQANLLDGQPDAEVVATAGGGMVRSLSDPDSYDQPVGKRFAYAVQAVNDLPSYMRKAGPASDAHALVLPGFLPVSGDTSIAHHHVGELRLAASTTTDDDAFGGQTALLAGGLGENTWRSVFQVNASQLTDARGRWLPRSDLGSATFLVYALNTSQSQDMPAILPPTLKEVAEVLGYNEHLAANIGETVELETLQEASELLDDIAPGYGDYVRENYGETSYIELLDSLLGDVRVVAVRCTAIVGQALAQGNDCIPAFPYPLQFMGLCDDASRDLEMEEIPYNCWEDGLGAFVSPESAYDIDRLTWDTQPRTEYWHLDNAGGRQTTRSETWRRYDILPAIVHDDNGDVTVILKKEREHTPSARVAYASTEAGAWLDDTVGPGGLGPKAPDLPWADGSGPDAFPWVDRASSGERAALLQGRGGVASIRLAPSGVATVPLDTPLRMDVFIPDGQAPREIGLRITGNLTTRSLSAAGRTCQEAYGPFLDPTLVTWGDEMVYLAPDGTLRLDEDGELDHAADLLDPRENFTGLHVAGVPPQRGKWVTLTFDLGQLLLENWAQRASKRPGLIGFIENLTRGQLELELNNQEGRGLIDAIPPPKTTELLDLLARFRGQDTSLWLPDHLVKHAAIYERVRPVTYTERVDSVFPQPRDDTDYNPYNPQPYYDYFIVPWVFWWENYDKFVEPWHCGLGIETLEVFAVGGDVLVDRVGPDIGPRLRVEAGGTLP